MLHNFLHNQSLGFSRENEMSYLSVKADAFFNVISSKGLGIYELFSFLGWVGVAVFVFLSGYGVMKSLPPQTVSESLHYVKRQYLKLLFLLLPALLLFILGDALQHNFSSILKRVTYLTMMANVAYPYVKCSPGVYWYFGLTFQFYLIYAFFGRYFTGKNLLLFSLLSIIILLLLCVADRPEILSIYRHCFTGWFIVFGIGAWMGMQNKKSPYI